MLHKLEKEIDDVDAKIGDRWRLLDRLSIFRLLVDVNSTSVLIIQV